MTKNHQVLFLICIQQTCCYRALSVNYSLHLKNQYLQGFKRVCGQDQLNHMAETDWLEEYHMGKDS